MSDEKSIAAVLKRSKLFSTLGDGELSSLIRDSRTAEVSYTAGESIYSDTSASPRRKTHGRAPDVPSLPR